MSDRHMTANTKTKAEMNEAKAVLIKLQGLYLFMGLAGGIFNHLHQSDFGCSRLFEQGYRIHHGVRNINIHHSPAGLGNLGG